MATLNRHVVQQQDLEQALNRRLEELKRFYGPHYVPSEADLKQLRRQTLDQILGVYALNDYIAQKHLQASDVALRKNIMRIAAFQEQGKFSPERYQAALQAQGETAQSFEARFRADLGAVDFGTLWSFTSFIPKDLLDALYALEGEQRKVRLAIFDYQDYLHKVDVHEQDLRAYYIQHRSQFRSTPRIDVEYLVLDKKLLAKTLPPIKHDDLAQTYQQNIDRYTIPAKRRLSHILLTVPAKASEKNRVEIKQRAQALLQRLRKQPQKFSALAKEYSQDPGSSQNGGDVGWLSPGIFVPSFEKAAMALQKKGALSSVVESNFGFHIIQLTSYVPKKVHRLAEVKKELKKQLRTEAVDDRFAVQSEELIKQTYEEELPFDEVATNLLLTRQQALGVDVLGKKREGGQLNLDQRVLKSLFSEDSLQTKRTVEPLEVASGVLVVARVMRYQSAVAKPFEDVVDEVEKQVRRARAVVLAREAGQRQLDHFRQYQDAPKGSKKALLKRFGKPLQFVHQKMPTVWMRALSQDVFRAPLSSLPTYVGAPVFEKGYVVGRVEAVTSTSPKDSKASSLRMLFERSMHNHVAQYLERSFLRHLTGQAKVEREDLP